MAQILADRRDIDFVLHEQLKVEALAKHEHFAEFNRKAIDLIVSEARNLAVKEILPTQVDGDRIGARFNSCVQVGLTRQSADLDSGPCIHGNPSKAGVRSGSPQCGA